MATVYILYSKTLDRFYTGSCAVFDLRLAQHLNKDFNRSFTAKVSDWETFLTIEELNYEQARSIEAHIKRMKSKKYLQNLKKYPELVSKLIGLYP